MTLGDLIASARVELNDTAQPQFWSDAWLTEAINEAEREACVRARLIEDSSSVASSLDIDTATKRYPLHPSVLDVLEVNFESDPEKQVPQWTLTETDLSFYAYPKADETLLLTVIRMPLSPMASDGDTPEIRSQHHAKLIDWVKYRAYSVQDADAFDQQGAAKAFASFERSFGPGQTANVQRKHKRKSARVVAMGVF